MKRIKSFKLFENSEYDYPDKFIEEILFDITDNDDVPLRIETTTNRCLILIGDQMIYREKGIPEIHNYVDNLKSLNEYMLDEGWNLTNIICFIPNNRDKEYVLTPIIELDFNGFLEKIEEIKVWNEKHYKALLSGTYTFLDSPIEWKTFKLVEICYEK